MGLALQFKRLAFAQVVLGIVAFCMAERNPGLLLIAGAIAALSWYVTEGPGGRPLPKWAISVLSLGAIAWLIFDLRAKQGHVIVAMGHFTMALQVLMLYGHKGNREYAQMLVLSLLQMIGATALSVSMIFGLLLAGYCVLSLVTVLLFQLKGTVDQVHEANKAAAPEGRVVPVPRAVVGRGHRWHFRATALTIGLVCGAFAITMFVVMPRTGQKRMGADLAGPLAKRQVGFSDTVRLNQTVNAHATREPVLNLAVTLHGTTLADGGGLTPLLRGAALDRYDRKERRWLRSRQLRGWDTVVEIEPEGTPLVEAPARGTVLQGQVTLRGSDDRTLFAVHPTTQISSAAVTHARFSPIDQRLVTEGAVGGTLVYGFEWPLGAVPGLDEQYLQKYRPGRMWRAPKDPDAASLQETYARGWQVQPQRVANLARRVLADAGIELAPNQTLDEDEAAAAARVLAHHLRDEFTYRLSNPDTGVTDPVIHFLFERRSGHCELFASGHAALCRSIGIPARVITGYRASEYNRLGGYYVVRQSHAHAWTEVYCGPQLGWRTYDATPPADVDAEHAGGDSWLDGARSVYDHFEYLWLRTIVAYDQRTRDAVLGEMSDTITTQTTSDQTVLGKAIAFIVELPRTWRLDKIGYTAAGIVTVMLGVAIGSLARLLILRRRKLVALQLTAVPRAKRRGMTRKLRFYLRMLEMIERHGHVRPAWQSPFQFATELSGRSAARFEPVVALTEVFYEVRFGHRDLDPPRRTRVKDNLRALERGLAARES